MLSKGKKFHTWWVESSSSIVQHYEFLDVLLQPLQQLSFWTNQKAERRVKERQEVTSSEGPPIAKPKPMIPAMAKTMNLLLHNPLMKNEAVIPSWCGLYQAKIQSNFLKWGDMKTLNMHTPGNKETRMNLRARPAPGNWCGRWTQRRLSITLWSPIINTWRMFSNICRSWESQQVNICNGSTEERQMCWYGDCSCLRQWKQPLILDNVEVYKNTNFEKIQNLFNITQKLTLEHSEIDSSWEYDWKYISRMDEIYILSWSNDQVDKRKKYMFTQILFYARKRCMSTSTQLKDGQVKWKNSKCHHVAKNCWESMEKKLTSSGNMFPGFTSLQILQETLNDFQKRNTEPEKFTDRIIFISMFNDFDWTRRGNEEVCISNSEGQGTRAEILAWTLDVPRSWRWKKWYGKAIPLPELKWDSAASQMVQRFKETVHPVFTSASALRVLKGKETTHFNANASTIHSVNQLSIYGAVSNWCEQLGLATDEKGKEKILAKRESVNQEILMSVNSQEVNFFGIFSKTCIWKQFAEKHSGFRMTVRDVSVHKALRRRIVLVRSIGYEDDGFGEIITFFEITHFLECKHPQSRAYAAIPERTIIGPDIEVHIVKILDNLGLEIAIPSPKNPSRTSCVLISKGQSRFVDELHIPSLGHDVTSAESLSEHANAKVSEPCLARSNTSSGNLVAASVASHSSTRKLDDPISVSSSPVRLFTERTISTTERKWQITPANSSYGGSLSTSISKMVTRLVRHYDQVERQSDGAVHWGTIGPKLVKASAKQGTRDFSEEALASTHQWRKQQDTVRILRGFQKFLGWLSSTLVEWQLSLNWWRSF